MKRTIIPVTCFAIIIMLISGCTGRKSASNNTPSTDLEIDPETIAAKMEQVLTEGMMDLWYPRCIDETYGGFLSGFDSQWNQTENQDKFIVMHGRHTWVGAQMARIYPDNPLYLKVSKHGYEYLKDVMWDRQYGGYFTLCNRQGEVLENENDEIIKTAYGNAFAIYGLAAYFGISNDSSALDLAIQSFRWLDGHSYDPEFGGYFQFLQRDGTPFVEGYYGTPPKDQNSSIHLLEAFTELYHVWEDEVLKARLQEMLHLIRDTITTEKGYMNLFFRRDWSPVYYTDKEFPGNQNKHLFDYISFGHDIETAFLLLEASKALGLEHDRATLRISKKMCDHTLQAGWDPQTGATYEAAYYFADQEEITILDHSTQWWASTETFHTLLLMSQLYPDDPNRYYDKFARTWNYCLTYLIDQKNGGWYRAGLNEEPEAIHGNKGGIWKGNYHNARSLINCIKMLRGE
jgi:mannobiose 2-epimerase